jgi:hypothetical protein
VPNAGYTSDNRFFGKGKEKIFVVKRPKYFNKNGVSFSEEEIKKIDIGHEDSYRKEQEVWNAVYPDNKATIFTEEGIRLVLPYIPCETLAVSLFDDKLIRCQQLLSVAYAVQKFNQLRFTYSDFNLDNVLIEEKLNGVFHAYLIDFHAIDYIKDKRSGNQELANLIQLTPGCDFRTRYETVDDYIDSLVAKIDTLKEEQSSVDKLFESFNLLPEKDRNDLIKQFYQEFILGKWNYEIWYKREGLRNFEIRKELLHFIKKSSSLIYEHILQNISEDEVISNSRLAF